MEVDNSVKKASEEVLQVQPDTGSEGGLQLTKNIKEMGEATVTFKTPSFVIPSKKKVQSNVDTSSMFKLPGKLSVSVGRKENEEKTVEKDIEKDMEDLENSTKIKADQDTESTLTDKAKDAYIKSKVPDSSEKVPSLAPAEQSKQALSAIPYKEPPWGSLSEKPYFFEVIKNGAIIDRVKLAPKSFHVIGRLPSCDVPMEHPSLSRHHAIIQHSSGESPEYPKGWYLFDLDSTHGTWINKNRVPPKKYHQLHVDFVLKFGGSTRLFILQGPDDDRLEESELSVKEMQGQREKQKKEVELLRQAEVEEAERKAEILKKREEDKGCAWGIDEDPVEEEEENQENPFANMTTDNEDLYIDDPKKSLNGYFEREGYDPPEYDFGEASLGKWKCSVELPIDGPNGEPITAEVLVSGKKREAVVACALEACRILDRHGELRKSNHESRKKKQKNWEEDDFYDSDEDVYLDRTGTIEKKREIRKMKVGKADKAADTYDSLLEKHKSIVKEIEETEAKIEQAKAQAAALESDDMDALDAYMTAIKSGMMDTKTKMKLKRQLLELKQEEQKVRKLVNIAKPASLPELKNISGHQGTVKSSLITGIGKMKGPSSHNKAANKAAPVKMKKKTAEDDRDFEVEEDEDDEESEDDRNNQSAHKSDKDTHVRSTEKMQQSEGSKKHFYTVTEKPKDVNVESKSAEDVDNLKAQSQENKVVRDSGNKLRGPSMPLAAVLEKLQNEADAMENMRGNSDTDNADINQKSKTKDTLKRKSQTASDGNKKMKTTGGDYSSSGPDYATWLPPENQAGDGKTSLNEKYGY